MSKLNVLAQRQSLPLEAKIVLSQKRIREWHEHWEGNVYVSFSGGKDSTVLLHLVRDLYSDVPAVFADTGLEYPEIRRFVKSADNVVWLKPQMTFRQVLQRFGYPVVYKEQAQYIYQYRTTKSEKLKDTLLNGNRWGQGKVKDKWRYLLDAPFPISHHCCRVMKKAPICHFEKITGRRGYLGTKAEESTMRRTWYARYGCNAFGTKRPISQPLMFWTDEDVWAYLRRYQVPYSRIYDMGWDRTGCMFCGFGVHSEPVPNRFQRMQQTHPRLYEYCMHGLGLAPVLAYMGVPYSL